MSASRPSPLWPPARRGFTVIELLVAVSILTLIVLALFGMFDQTQKALRANAAQVDVMEGGRTAMELLARELEQMAAPEVNTNLVSLHYAVLDGFRTQRLAGDGFRRTNVLGELYFLTRSNRVWTGIGYRVLAVKESNPPPGQPTVLSTNMASEGFGYLARFALSEVNLDSLLFPTNRDPVSGSVVGDPFLGFMSQSPTNLARFQRVASGVVDFRVRALDVHGQPIPTPAGVPVYRDVTYAPVALPRPLGATNLFFFGAALPAAVEVELGVLEPQTLDRLRSFETPQARGRYFTNQTSRVHLFQQRIPIRNAPRTLALKPTP